MPYYPYRCNACKYEFQVWQRITDAKLVRCKRCGALKLERLIAEGGTFILRGGGWASSGYGG
jgi:putative FmdB family regulatory protein